MGSVTYKANKANLKAILNSPGALNLVDEKAEAIRARAAGMYGAKGYGKKPARLGRGSAHSIVYTANHYAMRSNRKHATLSKAMRSVK